MGIVISRHGTTSISLSDNRLITEMNRSQPTDSKVWLDVARAGLHAADMITQPYHIYFERIDRGKNMSRFYIMSIEPTLFGEACLTRRWGRIGVNGQTKAHHFAEEKQAVALFLDLLRKKRNRGYRPSAVSLGVNAR